MNTKITVPPQSPPKVVGEIDLDKFVALSTICTVAGGFVGHAVPFSGGTLVYIPGVSNYIERFKD